MQSQMSRQQNRFFALLLISLMILETLCMYPTAIFAGESAENNLSFDVGVPNMAVTLKYGDKAESGTADSVGKYSASALYEYLGTTLGWSNQDQAPETTSVSVTCEVNYPNATSASNRASLGGNIVYKGVSETKTITYDTENPTKWSDEAYSLTTPEKEEVISGTVMLVPEGKLAIFAEKLSGATVTVKGTTDTAVSDENGKFSIYGYSKEATPDAELVIAATENYPSQAVKMSDFSGSLVLEERPTIKDTDYEIVGAENGYVKKPDTDTTYTIKALGDNKVSLERDGEQKDEVEVILNASDLTTTSFYVYKNGICSDKVANAIKVDQSAPTLAEAVTKAGKNVYIKSHGIYSKVKAELLITASVEDSESGVSKLSLIGKDEDGKKTTYESTKTEKEDGKTTTTFVIESQSEMLKQTLYLVATDKVGNKTSEVLLQGSENASKVTLEALTPVIDNIDITTGEANKNGWYNKPLNFSISAIDRESGLDLLNVTVGSKSLLSKNYASKETTKKNANLELTKEIISSEKTASGEYTIKVNAQDNCGNVAVKSKTVKIDLDAPVLSLAGVEKGSYLQSAPTITIQQVDDYVTAEGNVTTVEITRDGKEVSTKEYAKAKDIELAASSFVVDGNYEIKVNAEDAAGNKAKEVSTSFVKDSTAPAVTLSAPSNQFYNKTQSASITVTEQNYDTNKVVIKATKTVGGSTTNVSFPWSNSGKTSSSAISLSQTGTYNISVYAVDKAGNSSDTKTATFSVDQVSPTLSINGIVNGKVYTYDDTVAPSISYSDDYLASKDVVVTRAGANYTAALPKSDNGSSINFSNFAKVKENDGVYEISATATDKAGNSTTTKTSFIVNRFGSSFEYNDYAKKLNTNAVKGVKGTIVVTEKNVSDLTKTVNEVRKDGEVLKVSDATAKTSESGTDDGFKVYKHTFNPEIFSKDGVYELNVISEDKAGNTTESKAEAGKLIFTVDATRPTVNVSGAEKLTNADSVTLNIRTADNLTTVPKTKVTVDGKKVDLKKTSTEDNYVLTLKEGSSQKVKVTATDKAGNKTEYQETYSVVSSGLVYFLLKYKLLLIVGIVLILATGGFFFAKRRRSSDSNEAA